MIKKQCVKEWILFSYCKWNTIPRDITVWKGVFTSIWFLRDSLAHLVLEPLLPQAVVSGTSPKGRADRGSWGGYMMETINNRYLSPCSAFQGILHLHPVDDKCSVPCLVNTPCWMHPCALVCWKPQGVFVRSRAESLQHTYVNFLLSSCSSSWAISVIPKKNRALWK